MEDDQQMQRRVSARGASVFPSMERRKNRKTQPPGLKSRGAAEKRQTDLNCGGTLHPDQNLPDHQLKPDRCLLALTPMLCWSEI